MDNPETSWLTTVSGPGCACGSGRQASRRRRGSVNRAEYRETIRRPRGSPRRAPTVAWIPLVIGAAVLLAGPAVLGENVDPTDAGSQYAWGESVGLSLPGSAVPGGVVTPDSVVTTSYYSSDTANENMIDGSGLSGAGAVETQVHDAHAGGSGFTMWHAGSVDGGLGGPTGTPPPVAGQAVVFDLGERVWLDGVYIWNHNQAGATGRGVNEFEILVSGGTDPLTATFTSVGSFSLAQACGCATEPAQLVSFAAEVSARLVKFDIETAHSGQANDYVGLSEVRFSQPPDNVYPNAWGENIGWVNAEPQGNGGPGVDVSDDALTGWMWAEHAGWISLSCENTSSCGDNAYGVANDGAGTLSGYAWGEHLGWINFGNGSPEFGVRIDPFTGVFSGYAWTENHGWINFGPADTPQATQIVTGWRCPDPDGDLVCTVDDGCAAFDAAGRFGQTVAAQSGSVLAWPVAADCEVAQGTFTSSQDIGSFAGAAIVTAAGADYTDPSPDPPPGSGYWYLFRPDCAIGSYSTGSPSEQGDRDGALIL